MYHATESSAVLGSIDAEESSQVCDHLARVVFDAVDERRLAPAEHRQAEGVHARALHDAAVVPEMALVVHDGHVQPAVVRAIAGRPDDGTELIAREIDLPA